MTQPADLEVPTTVPAPMPRDAAPPVPEQAPLKLSRNRDYQLLMTGRTLSVIGGSMTGLALTLLAYDLTHNAATAALVASMGMIGSLLASLPAGVIVDSHDRQRVMVAGALVSAVVLASVPVAAAFHALTIAQLFVVSLVTGVVGMFYSPAETAALKRIVHPTQMGTAMSVNQARGSFASVIGPPLSGALYGLGRVIPFAVDAVLNVVVALFAVLVRSDLHPLREEAPGEKAHPLRDAVEGLRWMWHSGAMRSVALIAALVNFGLNAFFTAITLALRADGASATTIGLVETVAGVAGLVGSLAAAAILKRFPIGKLFVALATANVVFLAPLLWFRGPVAIMVCVALFMLALPAANTGLMTWTAAVVPDRLMGRVQVALGLLSMGLIPLGSIIAGALLEHVGRAAALGVGIAALVVSVLLALANRDVRSIGLASELGSAE